MRGSGFHARSENVSPLTIIIFTIVTCARFQSDISEKESEVKGQLQLFKRSSIVLVFHILLAYGLVYSLEKAGSMSLTKSSKMKSFCLARGYK